MVETNERMSLEEMLRNKENTLIEKENELAEIENELLVEIEEELGQEPENV